MFYMTAKGHHFSLCHVQITLILCNYWINFGLHLISLFFLDWDIVLTCTKLLPAIHICWWIPEPYSEYRVWVRAAFSEEDEPSEVVTKQTDVSGPGPPRIVNATCEAPFTLAIYWHQPPLFNKTIDSYVIAYREENSFVFSNITVKPTPCNSTCHQDKVIINLHFH